MKVALVGNPNSGKTTLFNALTGMNQKVGNWTGVTVEKKEGAYVKDKSIEIVDLPGIYSLIPYSMEEIVTAKFVHDGKPDCIIDIVDATNLERNLYLTTQLLEQGVRVVVALNMSDELEKNGVRLDVAKLEDFLGVEAVEISARKGKGIAELMERVKKPKRVLKPRPIDFSKLLQGVAENCREEEISNLRYQYLKENIRSFEKKGVPKQKILTDKIDRIVTNKWLAFPIFIGVIFLMYFLSIQLVGNYTTELLEQWIIRDLGGLIRGGLDSVGAMPWITSLLVDGIVSGVGTVLTFIPQIVTLFLFITVLEACGYMSRVAFIMDRLFKKLGLSGKSSIPLIIGCGCSVPAIMSARTVENNDERRLTVLLTPFVPCSAKLPVFALFVGAFFPDNPFVAPSMYLIGIVMIVLGGLLLKKLKFFKSEADTFVLELPAYRLPKLTNILRELWDKARGFLIKAGTIIFAASIVLWFLQSFSWSFQMVDAEESILASVGRFIAPVFVPLGFGNWQASVSLISGVFAKETIIATLGVLLGTGEGALTSEFTAALGTLFTPAAAYSFMVFVLLSSPCIAALSATKKEMGGWKWLFFALIFQTGIAYLTALVVYWSWQLYLFHTGIFVTVLASVAVFAAFMGAIRYVYKNRKKGGAGACNGNCAACRAKCPQENKKGLAERNKKS